MHWHTHHRGLLWWVPHRWRSRPLQQLLLLSLVLQLLQMLKLQLLLLLLLCLDLLWGWNENDHPINPKDGRR
jgi:hypothetical protein